MRDDRRGTTDDHKEWSVVNLCLTFPTDSLPFLWYGGDELEEIRSILGEEQGGGIPALLLGFWAAFFLIPLRASTAELCSSFAFNCGRICTASSILAAPDWRRYMWYIKQASKDTPEFAESAMELLRATARNLIWVTAVAYLVWHLVVTMLWSDMFMRNIWFIAPVVLLAFALANGLLERYFVLAQSVWLLGIALGITIAYRNYQMPEITFLYALLPLLASATLGRLGGLAAEGFIILLVWLISLTELALSVDYNMGIIAVGALTGVLGWAGTHSLLVVTHWSLYNFRQAQENYKEAAERRGEALRVMKALDQAYSQLERVNHMLVLARAEAEEAQEARNRFALAVSHELRTPLNFILGFSEMMVNAPQTYAPPATWPPGLYDDAQEIYRSSTHLQRLVNDVLDLGQIEARQMTLFKESVDLTEVVREVEGMVKPVLNRKGLWLHTDIDPHLPVLFIDRTRIRQVLLNLVTNSLRFTDRGGVTLRLQKIDEAVQVSVEDTGPGIAAEEIPRLFQEFRQVSEGSWRRREGSGLGIPISQRFIQLHGGKMWVESEVGQGSKFHFSLPLTGPATDQADFPLQELPSGEKASHRQWKFLKDKAERQRLLLVVSPDPLAGDLMEQYAVDFKIVAISEAEQIVSTINQFLPNALIVDQTVFDAPPVQTALQSLPYQLPVVSFMFPNDLEQLAHLPGRVSGYLVKPIPRRALADAVRALGPAVRDVLIIDDDPAMVRFVTLALESETDGRGHRRGYQLNTAYTGAQALEYLRYQPPDAVLLDLGLPDINGWEVLTQLRDMPNLAEIPVVIITANDLPQLYQADRQELLQVLLPRPFSRQELSAVLHDLLNTLQPSYPTPATSVEPGHPITVFG